LDDIATGSQDRKALSEERTDLVPLREFYGHPFRAVDEDQLS
jgi:hypothetical protein